MARRRSIGLAAVAVAVLVGSARRPRRRRRHHRLPRTQPASSTGTRSRRTRWPPLPGAERRCATRVPDQHGHGAGRRLRRGQRDRAEAASAVSAQQARRREGVDRRCRRNSRLRRALTSSSRRHPERAPFPGRAGLLSTLVHRVRRLARCDRRWRLQAAGHRRRPRGSRRPCSTRESERRTVRAVPVGAQHGCRTLVAALECGRAHPRPDAVGRRGEAVPHPELIAVPDDAAARARQRRSTRRSSTRSRAWAGPPARPGPTTRRTSPSGGRARRS